VGFIYIRDIDIGDEGSTKLLTMVGGQDGKT